MGWQEQCDSYEWPTGSLKLTWTGYFIGLYSLATDALVNLKWLNLGTTVDFIMVVYVNECINGLMDHSMGPPANMDVHNYPGNSHIKVTEMLVVSLFGANCRFWSEFGCLGWKVTIFAHSGIAYSTVHKEIHKKCPDSNQTEISLRSLIKPEPHPQWSPLVV